MVIFVNLLCPDSPPIMQGLFVPFACIGSGDPVRVLRLFHNKYSGYCCIHLLCKAMYNLSLPRLSANYYGLPTTVQLWADYESRCSLFGQLLRYCTVPALNGILLGPFSGRHTTYWNAFLFDENVLFVLNIPQPNHQMVVFKLS